MDCDKCKLKCKITGKCRVNLNPQNGKCNLCEGIVEQVASVDEMVGEFSRRVDNMVDEMVGEFSRRVDNMVDEMEDRLDDFENEISEEFKKLSAEMKKLFKKIDDSYQE